MYRNVDEDDRLRDSCQPGDELYGRFNCIEYSKPCQQTSGHFQQLDLAKTQKNQSKPCQCRSVTSCDEFASLIE